MKNRIKKVEEVVLRAAVEVVRKEEGALFVIGPARYERLLKQRVKPFSVFDKGAEKTLLGLAIVDGAVIIDADGMVQDYGAMIKNTKPYKGYGTRHAAAITAARNGTTSILCSEEERKIKVFRKGRLCMEIDALHKDIDKNIKNISTLLESHDVRNLFESIGAGFIGTVGLTALAPAVGIALVPGVLVFGGGYYAFKKFFQKQGSLKA
jgi:DNA integrity scanning protein DisA with diadenylate cyclase activity